MTKALSSVLYIARSNGIPTTIQAIGKMIFCNPTLLDCAFTDLEFDVVITFLSLSNSDLVIKYFLLTGFTSRFEIKPMTNKPANIYMLSYRLEKDRHLVQFDTL